MSLGIRTGYVLIISLGLIIISLGIGNKDLNNCVTDFHTKAPQIKFNLYYALFESKFSDLFLALMLLYTKRKEYSRF